MRDARRQKKSRGELYSAVAHPAAKHIAGWAPVNSTLPGLDTRYQVETKIEHLPVLLPQLSRADHGLAGLRNRFEKQQAPSLG
jgi:hypothetical protein